MPSSPFTRRIVQLTLLPAALSFAHLASAGVVVVARPAPVVVARPVVPVVIDHVAAPSVHYGWADVLRVSPVYGVARTEHHQECVGEPVVAHDSRRPGSTLLGAVYASRLNYDPGERMRVRIDVSPES